MFKLILHYSRNDKNFTLSCQMEDIDDLVEVLPRIIESISDYQYYVEGVEIERC